MDLAARSGIPKSVTVFRDHTIHIFFVRTYAVTPVRRGPRASANSPFRGSLTGHEASAFSRNGVCVSPICVEKRFKAVSQREAKSLVIFLEVR